MGRTKDHSLQAIVTIAILAVLSGADGFVAIETYGKAKQAWLETFLNLYQFCMRLRYIFPLVGLYEQSVVNQAKNLAHLHKETVLPHGIPSHDTFGRVFGMLDPGELQNSFLDWVSSITDKLGLDVIHVDGKTAKGSYDREGKLKSLHSVSAWSSEHGLVLAQQKVDDKSNEITAVPLLRRVAQPERGCSNP